MLAHVEHVLADAELYFLSFPQVVQPPEPAGEAYPATQLLQTPSAVVDFVSPWPLPHPVLVTGLQAVLSFELL